MIICVCRRISDRDIQTAAAGGAQRVREVFRHCGHAPQCGSCISLIGSMLAEKTRNAPVVEAAD